MLLAVCHSSTTGWANVDDLDRLSDLRAQQGNLLWAEADVSQLTEEDVATIAEEFDLHALAVEDAVHLRQRPKIDIYDNHLFLVMHQLNQEDGQLEAAQIACFIGPQYVLTLHEGATRTLEEAKKRWRNGNDESFDRGSAVLTHTLLDVVVDDYQRIANGLEDEVEDLEDIVLAAPLSPVQHQLYSVKQRTARLRRYVFPLQRVTDALLSPFHKDHIPEDTHVLFRDIQDHVLRISDQVRNIDELDEAAIDLRRSAQAETLNDATKKLSGWAAIIAAPTLITGIYGMNLGLWPTVGTRWGFIVVLAFIVILSSYLYVYFKRKDWI
jgi:magnesium transporter